MDKENVKIPKYDQMTYKEILIEKQFLDKQALSCIDIMKILKNETKSSRYQSVSGIMWQIVELEEYLKRL